MRSRIDSLRLGTLLARVKESDAELGRALGVNQSTVWRLRHGRIGKIDKYIPRLEAHLGLQEGATAPDRLDAILTLAEQSPALADVLVALGRFMQERA